MEQATIGTKANPIRFDHHAPELIEQVPELWHDFHQHCPVAWTDDHGGYWVVSGYDAVYQVSHDDIAFSSAYENGGVAIPTVPFQFGFIEMDPPEFLYHRRPLNRYLSPRATEKLEEEARDVTTGFLDEFIAKGSCELVAELASPVPAVLTMDLLGMSREKWKLFADANHHINAERPGTSGYAAAEDEMAAMRDDLVQQIERRRASGERNDDVLDTFCFAEVGGQLLSPEAVLADLTLVVNGGVDTTTALIGSSLKWLDQHPTERNLLRSEPGRIPAACEEFLRVFAPVTGLARTCMATVNIGGRTMEPGDRVLLLWAAANYDESAFPKPDEVDLQRVPNRHTSFGLGAHRCIGSNMARLVYRVVLEEVFDRMPDFAFDHDAARPYPSMGINRGWDHLHTTFTPGAPRGSRFKP